MKTPKIIKYPNGLTLVYLKKTNQKGVYFNIVFGGGLFNDPLDKLGLSHFVEHTIVFSDKKYSHDEKMEYLRKIYDRHFETGKSRIRFQASVHKDLFEDTFKTYCEYLSSDNMNINEDEFENERKVIEQEILRRKITNETKIQHMHDKHVYNMPYTEIRPAGTIETIKNISISDVEKFRKETFVINNCTIFVVGNVSLFKTKSLINKYAMKMIGKSSVSKKYIETSDFYIKTQKPDMIVEQSPEEDKSFLLISHCFDLENVLDLTKSYISAIINEIMQNAARSYFRDKYGLTYHAKITFGSYTYDLNNTVLTRCYVFLNVDCDKNNVAKILELLPGFYNHLNRYVLTKEKIGELKLTLKRDDQMKSIPSIGHLGEYFSDRYFEHKKYKTAAQLRQYERNKKKVSYEDVNNHIKTMLQQKPFIFVITNSEDKLPEYKTICKQIQDNIKWCKSINE